jgi:hypothetical protein
VLRAHDAAVPLAQPQAFSWGQPLPPRQPHQPNKPRQPDAAAILATAPATAATAAAAVGAVAAVLSPAAEGIASPSPIAATAAAIGPRPLLTAQTLSRAASLQRAETEDAAQGCYHSGLQRSGAALAFSLPVDTPGRPSPAWALSLASAADAAAAAVAATTAAASSSGDDENDSQGGGGGGTGGGAETTDVSNRSNADGASTGSGSESDDSEANATTMSASADAEADEQALAVRRRFEGARKRARRTPRPAGFKATDAAPLPPVSAGTFSSLLAQHPSVARADVFLELRSADALAAVAGAASASAIALLTRTRVEAWAHTHAGGPRDGAAGLTGRVGGADSEPRVPGPSSGAGARSGARGASADGDNDGETDGFPALATAPAAMTDTSGFSTDADIAARRAQRDVVSSGSLPAPVPGHARPNGAALSAAWRAVLVGAPLSSSSSTSSGETGEASWSALTAPAATAALEREALARSLSALLAVFKPAQGARPVPVTLTFPFSPLVLRLLSLALLLLSWRLVIRALVASYARAVAPANVTQSHADSEADAHHNHARAHGEPASTAAPEDTPIAYQCLFYLGVLIVETEAAALGYTLDAAAVDALLSPDASAAAAAAAEAQPVARVARHWLTSDAAAASTTARPPVKRVTSVISAASAAAAADAEFETDVRLLSEYAATLRSSSLPELQARGPEQGVALACGPLGALAVPVPAPAPASTFVHTDAAEAQDATAASAADTLRFVLRVPEADSLRRVRARALGWARAELLDCYARSHADLAAEGGLEAAEARFAIAVAAVQAAVRSPVVLARFMPFACAERVLFLAGALLSHTRASLVSLNAAAVELAFSLPEYAGRIVPGETASLSAQPERQSSSLSGAPRGEKYIPSDPTRLHGITVTGAVINAKSKQAVRVVTEDKLTSQQRAQARLAPLSHGADGTATGATTDAAVDHELRFPKQSTGSGQAQGLGQQQRRKRPAAGARRPADTSSSSSSLTLRPHGDRSQSDATAGAAGDNGDEWVPETESATALLEALSTWQNPPPARFALLFSVDASADDTASARERGRGFRASPAATAAAAAAATSQLAGVDFSAGGVLDAATLQSVGSLSHRGRAPFLLAAVLDAADRARARLCAADPLEVRDDDEDDEDAADAADAVSGAAHPPNALAVLTATSLVKAPMAAFDLSTAAKSAAPAARRLLSLLAPRVASAKLRGLVQAALMLYRLQARRGALDSWQAHLRVTEWDYAANALATTGTLPAPYATGTVGGDRSAGRAPSTVSDAIATHAVRASASVLRGLALAEAVSAAATSARRAGAGKGAAPGVESLPPALASAIADVRRAAAQAAEAIKDQEAAAHAAVKSAVDLESALKRQHSELVKKRAAASAAAAAAKEKKSSSRRRADPMDDGSDRPAAMQLWRVLPPTPVRVALFAELASEAPQQVPQFLETRRAREAERRTYQRLPAWGELSNGAADSLLSGMTRLQVLADRGEWSGKTVNDPSAFHEAFMARLLPLARLALIVECNATRNYAAGNGSANVAAFYALETLSSAVKTTVLDKMPPQIRLLNATTASSITFSRFHHGASPPALPYPWVQFACRAFGAALWIPQASWLLSNAAVAYVATMAARALPQSGGAAERGSAALRGPSSPARVNPKAAFFASLAQSSTLLIVVPASAAMNPRSGEMQRLRERLCAAAVAGIDTLVVAITALWTKDDFSATRFANARAALTAGVLAECGFGPGALAPLLSSTSAASGAGAEFASALLKLNAPPASFEPLSAAPSVVFVPISTFHDLPVNVATAEHPALRSDEAHTALDSDTALQAAKGWITDGGFPSETVFKRLASAPQLPSAASLSSEYAATVIAAVQSVEDRVQHLADAAAKMAPQLFASAVNHEDAFVIAPVARAAAGAAAHELSTFLKSKSTDQGQGLSFDMQALAASAATEAMRNALAQKKRQHESYHDAVAARIAAFCVAQLPRDRVNHVSATSVPFPALAKPDTAPNEATFWARGAPSVTAALSLLVPRSRAGLTPAALQNQSLSLMVSRVSRPRVFIPAASTRAERRAAAKARRQRAGVWFAPGTASVAALNAAAAPAEPADAAGQRSNISHLLPDLEERPRPYATEFMSAVKPDEGDSDSDLDGGYTGHRRESYRFCHLASWGAADWHTDGEPSSDDEGSDDMGPVGRSLRADTGCQGFPRGSFVTYTVRARVLTGMLASSAASALPAAFDADSLNVRFGGGASIPRAALESGPLVLGCVPARSPAGLAAVVEQLKQRIGAESLAAAVPTAVQSQTGSILDASSEANVDSATADALHALSSAVAPSGAAPAASAPVAALPALPFPLRVSRVRVASRIDNSACFAASNGTTRREAFFAGPGDDAELEVTVDVDAVSALLEAELVEAAANEAAVGATADALVRDLGRGEADVEAARAALGSAVAAPRHAAAAPAVQAGHGSALADALVAILRSSHSTEGCGAGLARTLFDLTLRPGHVLLQPAAVSVPPAAPEATGSFAAPLSTDVPPAPESRAAKAEQVSKMLQSMSLSHALAVRPPSVRQLLPLPLRLTRAARLLVTPITLSRSTVPAGDLSELHVHSRTLFLVPLRHIAGRDADEMDPLAALLSLRRPRCVFASDSASKTQEYAAGGLFGSDPLLTLRDSACLYLAPNQTACPRCRTLAAAEANAAAAVRRRAVDAMPAPELTVGEWLDASAAVPFTVTRTAASVRGSRFFPERPQPGAHAHLRLLDVAFEPMTHTFDPELCISAHYSGANDDAGDATLSSLAASSLSAHLSRQRSDDADAPASGEPLLVPGATADSAEGFHRSFSGPSVSRHLELQLPWLVEDGATAAKRLATGASAQALERGLDADPDPVGSKELTNLRSPVVAGAHELNTFLWVELQQDGPEFGHRIGIHVRAICRAVQILDAVE